MPPVKPQGFANLGATPFNNQPFKFSGASAKPYNILQPPTTTPKSNALSAMATGQPGVNMTAVPPKPTTPVKAETTTGVDGATHKVEYQNANTGSTTGLVNKPVPASTPATTTKGMVTGTPTATQNQQQANVQANLPTFQGGQQVSGTSPGPSYPGIVGQTVQTTQAGSPVATQAGAGLLGMGSQPSDAYTQAVKNLQEFRNKYSQAQAGVELGGTDIAFKTGAGAVLARQAAAQESALQQAVANTLQGQQQQIGALTAAGGIGTTAQGLQQGGLLGAAGLVPEALRYGGTGAGSPMGDSIQNALNMIRSGATTQDAMAHIIGGDVGKNAFINEMQKYDSNWNPTATNAIALQNMKQGQTYQGQSAELTKTLKQVEGLKPMISDFFDKTAFGKQDTQWMNNSIATYIGNTQDPVGKNFMSQMVADINNYTSQILAASSGLIPTEVSNAVASFDPSGLNKEQILPYLDNLYQLGQIRLGPIQQAATGSYGGTAGYLGGAATPTGTYQAGPQGTSQAATMPSQDPMTQAAIGSIMNIIGGATGFIRGIAGTAASVLK